MPKTSHLFSISSQGIGFEAFDKSQWRLFFFLLVGNKFISKEWTFEKYLVTLKEILK